jgi:hypothetical protein
MQKAGLSTVAISYINSTTALSLVDPPGLTRRDGKAIPAPDNSGAYRCTHRRIVVWASEKPRSAIISTRSRKLSLKRRYHRTHRMMTSRSTWRPANNSCILLRLPLPASQFVPRSSLLDQQQLFAPEPKIVHQGNVHKGSS